MKPFNNIAVSPTEPENGADIWIKHSNNLIDKNNLIEGYRIGTNGSLFEDDEYFTTDYIEVKSNTQYIVNYTVGLTTRMAFYDEIYSVISMNDTTKTFLTPANAKYIRLGITEASVETAMLSEGDNELEYEPYVEDDILIRKNNKYYSWHFINKEDVIYTLNEEIKIGKWINGKDLYQKVLKINAPNVTQDGSMIEKTLDLDTDIEEGFIKNAWLKTEFNSLFPLNYTATNGNTIFVFVRTGTPRLVVQSEIQEFSNREIIVVLLYTKKDN